jgi:uncharacterized protein (DUF4213/DUF364 family)
MKEPIEYFKERDGFDRNRIAEWAIGDKYTGIMNSDGYIGVCATLGTVMNDTLFREGEPDTGNPCHRVILNAWFNSLNNYSESYKDNTDIFDTIDFRHQGKIVMVGYFESLYNKFSREGIALEVFDLQKESAVLSNIKGFEKAASECDTMILTGTTIFNNTFMDVISRTGDNTTIYLLGPSNILSGEMFRYRNIDVVFGSVFARYDHELLGRIRSGSGTRGFLDRLKKVYIKTDNLTL